jgi:SAM-dependent methyltransferase
VIVCPLCDAALDEDAHGFVCPSCPYRAERDHEIVVFERNLRGEFTTEGLDALYEHERDHPWFRHRLGVIRKAFATHVSERDAILEVGGGTGHTARMLLEAGYRDVSLGEVHPTGLAYAKRYGVDRLYQFDLGAPPFREHFDVVGLFDVLEHIRGDARAVAALRGMLRSGGRVILTVPAHRWLWSRIDDLSGHHRRYNRRDLTSVLSSGGLDIVECRYFFTALVPGLILRSVFSRDTTPATLGRRSGLTISRLQKVLLGLLCGPGDAVFSPLRPFVGGSLLAVARKR